MKQALGVSLLAALMATSALAAPAVTGLLNNYGYIRPGLPNYGIAQGSIFQIYGSGLSSQTLGLQGAPMNKNYGGVTITVTVNGTATTAIPYSVSPGQINAILPSATPVGTGTITVASGGATSPGFPITVVQSAFGILTMNGAGSGLAAALDSRYQFLGITNAANPGEYVNLWGTGIGPITGDETQTPPATNLSTINAQVWVGGKAAQVTYRGRGGYPGLDQIQFVVPSGVSGCQVAIVVQTGNFVSNTVFIPVATSGRACSDNSGLTGNDLTNLLNKGDISYGSVGLSRTTTSTPPITYNGIQVSPGQTTTADVATGTFIKFTATQLNAAIGQLTQTSYGSCIVATYSGSVTNPYIGYTLLDAGNITLNGPGGAKTLQKQQGFYSADLGTNYIGNGGAFSFAGSGGANVGAFNVSLNVGTPVKWTNMDQVPTTIQRSQGVTVTWTGGAPNSTVQITGSSVAGTDLNNPLVATFICTEKASVGTFTVPGYVLLALPSGSGTSVGGITIPTGSLAVGNMSDLVPFTATGIDFGYATWSVTSGKSVSYN